MFAIEPSVNLSRRRPTFPRSYPRSIIGPARLNFRVRDGNGCDPRGMTTGNLKKFSLVRFSVLSQNQQARNFEVGSDISQRRIRKASPRTGRYTRSCRQQFRLAITSSARCRTYCDSLQGRQLSRTARLLARPPERRCFERRLEKVL